MTGKQTWTLALAALLVCAPLSACGGQFQSMPRAEKRSEKERRKQKDQ